MATKIRKPWRNAREGWRGGSRTAKDRGKAGNIGMLVQIQVKNRWADDPVRRHNGRRWMDWWGRRGLPPPQKDIRKQEGRAGQDKYT